ncbi:MAG: NAD(P)-dependent oxidoreductase [Luteitalea sp.]|nr:NAD(P)-dependent oxidoreductase [Luteitalea sp.]
MTGKLTVSVIGLGTMGTTLARLLLGGGYRVTVWNRTRRKADVLVEEGTVAPPSAAAAIAASDVVIVCVYDYKAANEILATKEVEAALAGRVIVQLTTGSPQEARDGELWARRHHADYVDGAIQAAPSQMARPDTTILVSGAESAYRRSEPVLSVFGGNVKYLGEPVGAASTMDLATLSYVYGAALGFFHGARIAESEGFRVDHYGGLVAEISPSFGEFFRHEGAVIQSGDYRVSESPLKISVEATERLAQAARDGGLNAELPEFAARLFKRALAAGYGDQEVAAFIKVLRASGSDSREHPAHEREHVGSPVSHGKGGCAMKPRVSRAGPLASERMGDGGRKTDQ